LVRVNEDVLSLGILVAGDDLVAGNIAVNGTSLLVVDAAIAFGVELVQMDFIATAGRRRKCLDRNGYQTEFQEALPAGARSHSNSGVSWTAFLVCGEIRP